MNDPTRSPELMDAATTALLVVDLQERLLAAQPDAKRLVWNAGRLLDAAAALSVDAVLTEQVPEKLGKTAGELAERGLAPLAKQAFSAAACDGLLDRWHAAGVVAVAIAGIETHVCVAQSALDLIAAGFQVSVVVDAVGSRFPEDHGVALRRLESAGASLATTEAAMFEWCQTADRPEFRAISSLAKQTPPS